MSAFEYVTLVAFGGTPVRVANANGTPFATTGTGALVFANGATLTNVTISGFTPEPPIGLPLGGAITEPPVYWGPTSNGIRSLVGGNLQFVFDGNVMAELSNGNLTLSSSLVLTGGSSGAVTIMAPATGTGTLTAPAATDTIVARATTDTLTNKTMSGASNTFTNIPLTTAVTGQLPVANGGTAASSAVNAAVNLSSAYNVADLTALKALTSRPPVVVMSYRSVSTDGGGGVFFWASGSAVTANDATVVQCTSGAAGRYIRLYSGAMNAAWFGYLADNSTDNSTALQNAITAAVAATTNLYIPPGRGKMASTVNVTGACTIFGAGWEETILVPTADGITTMFNVTGEAANIRDLEIDASAIVAPTFTAIKWNSSGFNQLTNVYIYGAGTGLLMPKGNACTIGPNIRIQACPVGVQQGGTNLAFPGDTTWRDVVIIPTAAGTGIIQDGNTNAQRMHHVLVTGGVNAHYLRGTGAGTSEPDGIELLDGTNYTQTSSDCFLIEIGFNVLIGPQTVIGASTGESGVLINAAAAADVEGVIIQDAEIRANAKYGVKANKGTNILIQGGEIYGNSQGAANTYSNIYVGAAWLGLAQVTGCMAGISNASELFANIQGPSKYGIELAANSCTTSGAVIGRVHISSNMLEGNTTGPMSDGSTPDFKYIGPGQNPSGPTSITVGASPYTYTSGGGPEVIYLDGGVVSGVSVGGSTMFTTTPCTICLERGQAVVITHTGAPNAYKFIQ